MKKKHFTRRRIVSILLAAVLSIGCLPFMAGGEAYADTWLPAPDYNGRLEVYSTSFKYYPFGITSNNYGWMSGDPAKLYLEYSSDRRNWTRTGYMKYNFVTTANAQCYRFSGFKPNKKYALRIWYGDEYGNRISPIRNIGTIQMGRSDRPPVKSVVCQAVNVKHHVHRVAGHYYWTGYHLIWNRPFTERYYTYKVKVTVRLRKKPGANGLWINGKWVPGNKTVYTATFSPYPNYSSKNPRGRISYSVSIYSGRAKSYGGYSPGYKKKMKLK